MSGLSLLAPVGLIALIGLPLIVLFHMRHTTPVVQQVPSLRFWRLAQLEESERERFRRPPITIFLLLHLLLVALLAFALSRPATTKALGGIGSRTEPRHLILLIDGSTSMSAQTSTGQTRFAAALLASDIRLADLHQGDVATVVLMGTHSTTMEATSPAEIRAVRDRLRGIPLPGGIADLNGALKLSKDLLLPSMTDQIVVVTDGAVTVDPEIAKSINASISLVTVGDGATANLAVTDLSTRGSVRNPGQQQLYARIINFGTDEVTTTAVISADGLEVARADYTVQPGGQSTDITQDLPAGAKMVTINLNTPDALAADNTASSVLQQNSDFGLRILLATDAPSPLQRALTVLPGAVITTKTPVEADAMTTAGAFDLVVYEHSTPKGRLPDAPLLIVDPDEGGLLPTNGVVQPTVTNVRAQDPLLVGVEMAGVTFGQTPVLVMDSSATEIVAGDAGPLIYRATEPGGTHPMIVLAFDVAASNLPQRVAFPILVANIANELVPSALPAAVALGDPVTYRPRSEAAAVRVTLPDGTAQDIPLPKTDDAAAAANPALRDVTIADTGQAGVYAVAEIAADGAATGGGSFVVNAGHRAESNLTPNLDLGATLALAVPTGDAGASRDLSDIWPALAAAALALLLIEWGLTLLPRRKRQVRRIAQAPAV